MSTPPLFLLDALPADGDVRLSGPEGRHAVTVRRLRVGEPVVLGNGRGSRRRGTVVRLDRDELIAECGPVEYVAAADPRIVLAQALAKGDRAELAVETSTELGVDEIVPWAAARSIVQWQGERGERSRSRWASTAREAAKQSRRAWVPTVGPAVATRDLARRIGAVAAAFVLHEAATEPLASAPLPTTGDVVVVVGPEGGVTDDELAQFSAAGARAVRLGRPVLRTSTAGAAACAALSVRLGRWS